MHTELTSADKTALMVCTDAAILSTLVSAARHLPVAPTIARVHCGVVAAGLRGDDVGARHLRGLTATAALHGRHSVTRPTLPGVAPPLTPMSIFCNYNSDWFFHDRREKF